MPEPVVHVVLYEPEIPQNTGNVGRLCLGVGARLHLVRPLGFDIDEKAVRRAGLDYWRDVDLVVHDDAAAFWRWVDGRRACLFSAAGAAPYTDIPWEDGTILVFGRESVGLPRDVVAAHGAWRIPAPGPIRSLNLGNAVSVVVYEGLKALRPQWFA